MAIPSPLGRSVGSFLLNTNYTNYTNYMERPKRERLIIDNRSSRPLYEAYEQAFNFYFEEWCEEYETQAMTWNGFVFYMRTNKDSITIQIYDDKNK